MQKVHHHYHFLQMTSLNTRPKFTVQSGDGDLFKLLQPRHLGPWHQLHRPLQASWFLFFNGEESARNTDKSVLEVKDPHVDTNFLPYFP